MCVSPDRPYESSRTTLLLVLLMLHAACLKLVLKLLIAILLHYQATKELAEMLLDHICNPKLRREYMGRTVLTAVEGQRPRHLSAIHIACLKGDTSFVEMLLQRDVDVNTTNSKASVVTSLWLRNILGKIQVYVIKKKSLLTDVGMERCISVVCTGLWINGYDGSNGYLNVENTGLS